MSYKTHHVLSRLVLAKCPPFARYCERYTEEELHTIVKILDTDPKRLYGAARSVRASCEGIRYGRVDVIPPNTIMLAYAMKPYRASYDLLFEALESQEDSTLNAITTLS